MHSKPRIGMLVITVREQSPYVENIPMREKYAAFNKAIRVVDKLLLSLRIKGRIGD